MKQSLTSGTATPMLYEGKLPQGSPHADGYMTITSYRVQERLSLLPMAPLPPLLPFHRHPSL